MRNDKIRRFRPRPNKFRSRNHINGIKNNGMSHQSGSHRNGLSRNNISKNPYNLERLIEKYKNLAKEALSTGDKVLHENYLQHSDHFSRILSELGDVKSKSHLKDEKITNTEKTDTASEKV